MNYLHEKILNLLFYFGELFPKSSSERFIESMRLSCEAFSASSKHDHDKNTRKDVSKFELYQQAILVFPENPLPYWQMISLLHGEDRDEEAFDFFMKVENLDYKVLSEIILNEPWVRKWMSAYFFGAPVDGNIAIYKPAAVGMLVALGKLDMSKEFLVSSMLSFWDTERSVPMSPWATFMDQLPSVITYLSLDDSKKFIRMLLDVSIEKDLPESELQPCYDACIEKMVSVAFDLVRVGRFSEALARVEYGLNAEVKNFRYLNRKKLLEMQRTIQEEIRNAEKWNMSMSDDEFLRFLFKRLAFRFHPDFETDEQKRTEKTKIMQEINHAKDEKSLKKLEDIVNEHVPEWSKYLKNRNNRK